MIIDHTHPEYREKYKRMGSNRFNGAYYYSKEIVSNIIPRVMTNRNWITINIPNVGCDHAIVFIHNNKRPEHYDWLAKHSDLILVCGIPETVEKVSHLGKAVYLPLSIDIEEVQQFKAKKSKNVAFVGRKKKRQGIELPIGVDYLEGMPRKRLLRRLAEYEKVYAVGRCALEAKALGCEILPYDPRFPNVDRWEVKDNKEAAAILQGLLNEIDGELVPIRHGRWINIKDDFPMCSECGYFSPFDHDKCDYEYGNYCPNCGAKMDEE